ncbi:MAG: PHP domain-containing protein [Acetivibrionales bacterium]|jgi:hypothetical protein
MNERYKMYVQDLNNDNVEIRLNSLKELVSGIEKGDIDRPHTGNDVNNHIHTTYSFSPYSPTKAVWMAYNAGLMTAGIMDHDSISGAEEFIEAGRIIGMATTIGAECRVDFSDTPLKGKRINNPDQKSVVYMALHGIPHTQIGRLKRFFAPYTAERNKRNVKMTGNINELMKPHGIAIDFEKDVVPLSKLSEGGSITERHIMFALSKKMVSKFGKGKMLVDFLKNTLKLDIKSKIENYLLDAGNIHYEYDLLGALKSDMVGMIYIDADAECPDVREVIALANEIGCIAAYAYLGDVGDSVTGDKKSQKFEDDYIELLFEVIKELGFHAVTYMPSRNTLEQLKRVKSLCDKHGLFQISGEDINQPRQSFVCEALKNEEFHNLIDSTWALIGHEKAATEDIKKSMFSKETISKYPSLDERTRIYMNIGKGK